MVETRKVAVVAGVIVVGLVAGMAALQVVAAVMAFMLGGWTFG